MKNICNECNKQGKCYFEVNQLVCKKLLQQINKDNESFVNTMVKPARELYYQHHIK